MDDPQKRLEKINTILRIQGLEQKVDQGLADLDRLEAQPQPVAQQRNPILEFFFVVATATVIVGGVNLGVIPHPIDLLDKLVPDQPDRNVEYYEERPPEQLPEQPRQSPPDRPVLPLDPAPYYPPQQDQVIEINGEQI